MFCLRAKIVLSGVVLCALTTGCASSGDAPAVTTNRNDQPAVAANSGTRQYSMDCQSDPSDTDRPITREQIINWSVQGVSDDLIIDRLQHNPTTFHLSTSDEIHLRDAGVSDEVIRAIKATAG